MAKAHDRISAICVAVAAGKGRLIELLAADSDISKIVDRQALERLLDPTGYLGQSGVMVDNMLQRNVEE